jgi:catechol 1,2-dioxygenase
MNHNKIFRRNFLIAGTSAALASWASPTQSATQHAQPCSGSPPAPTGADVAGPFFRDGSPQRTILHRGNEDEILTVRGTVSGGNTDSGFLPVPHARIEIWHASPTGLYDNDSDSYLYRAHFFTNADGSYAFETATPMGYRDGPLDRPAHIHYRIMADGFKPLTTQLYFSGDPKMDGDKFVNENDGYARAVLLERLGPGRFVTSFDIRLETAT